ncbi:MAG: asparagine synthase (glutamine-hydrolyzing) [Rubricoccaceae bacterium]
MCGFAAAFAYRAPALGAHAGRDALGRAAERMARRGPDGEGVWTSDDGRAGLAHRRLAIIDLSEAGAQPMVAEAPDDGGAGGEARAEGALRIVFNGEIYNYRALRAALEAEGQHFRSDSDTEVILHLYRRHGAALAGLLRGMFAFALYDEARGGVLLARDPYGIKPLYLADDGHTLRAASQVKALLAMGGVDTAPDPAGHAGFFAFGFVPEPHTLYRGIRALPPGTTLWADARGAGMPQPFASVEEALGKAAAYPAPVGPDEARAALREALLDTVRAHLVADVPVGVFLSSGLDSATLAALAAEAGGDLRTVTLGFDEYAGTPDDEVPLAEAVAAHYGAAHTTVRVGRAGFEAHLAAFLDAMDQPSMDGLNSFLVSYAAREAGLKVALSGVGGDELFGGYPSFAEVPRLVRAAGRVPGAGALGPALRALAAPIAARVTSPKYAGLLEYGTDFGGAYLLRRALHAPWELPRVMDPDLAREGWAALEARARLAATAAAIPGEGPAAAHLRVSALESTWYMRSQLLRDTDWASMAHSLEVRTPLVDWALLRAVAPLIARQPGLGKRALAETPARALPPALLNRPKTGFTTPVRRWAAEAGLAPEARGQRGWAQFVYENMTGLARSESEADARASVPA